MLQSLARLTFLRMRRLSEVLLFVSLVVIVLTISSKWTSKPAVDHAQYSEVNVNAPAGSQFLARAPPMHQNLGAHPQLIEKASEGRPTLAKYIHLDLKGAPPQAAKFYPSFFPFVKKLQMGVKGFLIEYEDMLPLKRRFVNATHRFPYSLSDIEMIQTAAQAQQLELIPLIQTFGHLEWLLKLREFELYRDDLASPMVITPCLENTYALLEDLLQQTLELHPNSNIIHIGCDEVTLTNTHPQCRETTIDPAQRYIDHVKRVVNMIRQLRPGMRILIWDDVIRSDQFLANEKLLNELQGLVEPVSWHYRPTFEESYINSPVWNIYSKLFSNLWIASAYKGGLSRYSMQTNGTHHVLNQLAWLDFLQSKSQTFAAIILTGWSRFDHFMPLCDLLPTAYQSLISSLYMLDTGKNVLNEYNNDCDGILNTIGKDAQLCQSLPGLSIWSGIASLSSTLAQIDDRLSFLHTVAPAYNRKHLFVRRAELDSRLAELSMFQHDLLSTTQMLHGHFNELYALDVIDEWFELYISPTLSRINSTLIEFSPVRNQTTWSRRPLI